MGVGTLIATTDADGRGRLPVDLEHPVSFKEVPTVFFSRQWSESYKYSRPLARWLQRKVTDFDVVHVHAVFSHSSLASARACKRSGIPYVIRPLGSLDPWSLNQKRFGKRLLWNFGVKQMLFGSAAIHYTTAAERRSAELTLGLTDGAVIPLGVEQELLDEGKASESFRSFYPALRHNPYVLILCRLHPKKSLELFLEVFLNITETPEFQRWRLVVAGDGSDSYAAHLKNLVRERGADGRILFTGWLDGAEKAAALRDGALLALPSQQENFGLSVVEAMACGVPVLVTTNVNLAEEIQAAGAGWVAPLERGALAHTLEEALRNEGDRLSRGISGRNLVLSRFTWSATASGLTSLYHSVRRTDVSPNG